MVTENPIGYFLASPKQSYTPIAMGIPPQPKPVHGYVEPVPEFYARMLALTEMTENGLDKLDVLESKHWDRLNSLESPLNRLIEISNKELENYELTEADYEFIRNFGENLDAVVAGMDRKVNRRQLLRMCTRI
jgi:hypothetical protein